MENKPNSVGSLLKFFHQELKNHYDGREINQFLHILFDEWKGWNRALVHINQEEIFSKEEVTWFQLALEELKRDKPIQYITGSTHFHGLKLVVTPDVLIPRPETEELVDLIIKENTNKKNGELTILDIGTGSGCIAVSLKKNLSLSSVSAMDNSLNALKVACENADRNGCTIRFLHHDIFQRPAWSDFSNYDIIVSNPPYIRESEKKGMHKNVLNFEPHNALFVPDDDPLVYYNAIADFAIMHISRPGLLYLEINEKFGPEIRTLLLVKNFDKVEIIKDINDKDRFIRAEVHNQVIPSGYRN
jgi:release factor glutamine methyltransferase